MTVFLEVAKTVIRDTIEDIIVEAQSANKSMLWGVMRNVELSEAKCKRLQSFSDSIPKIMDGLNDEATLVDLQTFILGWIEEIKAESTALHRKEGSTELNLKCLSDALPSIYMKLESLPLLNVPYGQDPLSQFRYFMALYYAKKIVRDHKPSFKLDRVFESGRAFMQEQDLKVQSELEECTQYMMKFDAIDRACPDKIKEINETKFTFRDMRAMHVLCHVHNLRSAHMTLREKYSATASVFTLDGDILEQCLTGVGRILSQQLGMTTADVKDRRDSLPTPRMAGGAGSGSVAARTSFADENIHLGLTKRTLEVPRSQVSTTESGHSTLLKHKAVAGESQELEERECSVSRKVMVGLLPTVHADTSEHAVDSPLSVEASSLGEGLTSLALHSGLCRGGETREKERTESAAGITVPSTQRQVTSTQLMLDSLALGTGPTPWEGVALPTAAIMAVSASDPDIKLDDAAAAPIHFQSPLATLTKRQKRQLKKEAGAASTMSPSAP